MKSRVIMLLAGTPTCALARYLRLHPSAHCACFVAGHMVPEFKPAAASEMIKQFLTGGDYQKFKHGGSDTREREL